ncbi:MAG TPA: glutamine amidotransferase [Gammaproteobacteria bacterium]|mgnify:FL=1|jgi:GMP synthase (glutamine-hydrolysing)|nr:glutamine amidotransferase [Gammaproteobacteria bacterium]MDP6732545.1 glutamine amidotransferase [Gammaproteobacteria bacterium]HAJ76322.1 glutamine amidotransferase [Gammaproteobacteria bacterium]|tara:strand:+ start:576 stop:1307 length:732 start_codon:yes stop_codon:yes gene_type:complete
MPKPFLIIQLRPEDETADNEFESIKFYGGLTENDVIRVRAEVSGLPALDLNDYTAIIVGGSPFNISEAEDQKSTIQRQVETDFFELFDAIVDRDFPFLGCCSGNGLLGSYCGATISRKYGEPVGGANIELTEEGRNDPLLEGLPDSFRVLLGHKEACDALPPGCVLLATNEACPVQMFRLRKNIYAVQFHPEGDAEGFIVRIHAYKHYGYFPPESAQQLIAAVEDEHVPEAQSILRRFVELYR